MYQKKGAQAYRPDLSRIEEFCDYLGNPHDQIKTIHVAGTNGKGSTAHIIASILHEHNLKVGLYTSPHLKDFRERIKINGELIEKDFVVDFVQKHRNYFELHSLSFFEMTVGLAFCYFSKKKVDIGVIEVGMGGRLDGTNLIQPEFCVITNIGLDHTQFLGKSLAEIAEEKAGIIKRNTPVIIGLTQPETQAIFQKKSSLMNAEIIFSDQSNKIEYKTDLVGNYQKQNIQTAVEGLRYLNGFDLDPVKLDLGLMKVVANTGIRGRWEVLNHAPIIVADVAHNKEGLQQTLPQIDSYSFSNLIFVLGFVKDKKVDEILSLFPNNAEYFLSAPQIQRAFPIEDLEGIAQDLGLQHQIFSSVETAFLEAKKQANADDFIYVGGSTFVVAEIL